MSEHNKFYSLSSSGSPLLMLHSSINPRAYNEKQPFMNTKNQEHVPQARNILAIHATETRESQIIEDTPFTQKC